MTFGGNILHYCCVNSRTNGKCESYALGVVSSNVAVETAPEGGPEGAVGAGEGLLPRVRPQVNVQVVLPGGSVRAVGAGEGPLACVRADVAFQVRGEKERFRTQRARVLPARAAHAAPPATYASARSAALVHVVISLVHLERKQGNSKQNKTMHLNVITDQWCPSLPERCESIVTETVVGSLVALI